jgi:hypothetical protein
MAQETLNKIWRLEVYDPQKSAEWKPLLRFAENQRNTYQKLANNLNRINYPIRVRVAPDTY